MPGRFMATAAGPSQGPYGTQLFRRQGKAGRDWVTAIGDIQAMSARWQFVGAEAARNAADIMEQEIVKYVDPNNDPSFTYSEGRLAATIGTWKPWMIKDPDVLTQAEKWAERNNVSGYSMKTRDVQETLEMGAYRSIRHSHGQNYTAEVGTFTPYAGLVEDGGSMPIHPYGDQSTTITATWAPHHMFKNGLFDAEPGIEALCEDSVNRALNASGSNTGEIEWEL